MKSVSFIITSVKKDIETVKHLKKCPLDHEIIISDKKGIGLARNTGASLSQGKVLVFLDDDLTIYPRLFEIIPEVQEGSFFMAFQAKMPVTRCLIIHRKDFKKVLFREEIELSGEDRDFFMRALKTGLSPFFLSPKGLYQHKEHKIRFKKNRLNSIRMMYEHAKVLASNGAYMRFYGGFLAWFFPYLDEKRSSIWLYGASIFWISIRNIFLVLTVLTRRRYDH